MWLEIKHRPLPRWAAVAIVMVGAATLTAGVARIAHSRVRPCCCVIGDAAARVDGDWCDPADCERHGDWWYEQEQLHNGEVEFQLDLEPVVRVIENEV